MPTIIDGSASATFATPLPLLQGGTGNTSGNVVSSQVAGALNATGSAPLYACRAWVNFNGTGTVAIRASGNVSSITDNGTGLYRVNFATEMADVNYTAVTGVGQLNVADEFASQCNVNGPYLTTSITLATGFVVPTLEGLADRSVVQVAIFR